MHCENEPLLIKLRKMYQYLGAYYYPIENKRQESNKNEGFRVIKYSIYVGYKSRNQF